MLKCLVLSIDLLLAVANEDLVLSPYDPCLEVAVPKRTLEREAQGDSDNEVDEVKECWMEDLGDEVGMKGEDEDGDNDEG